MLEPVSSRHYTRDYFEASCGGAEFFRRYGPAVLKPPLARALKAARLASGMRVLDVGCGRGELLHHAARAGAWGTGTDFAWPAVRLAREVSGAPTLLCDAKALPFADASFDRVFFVGVVDHLRAWELEACFAELARVLRPGGFVLVHTCANRHYYKSWTYPLRLAAARALRRLGLPLRDPLPPRSEEDVSLHVNEQTLAGLGRFFGRIGWEAEIVAVPNPKYLVRELYGDPLPADFPLLPVPEWKAAAYRAVLFPPLKSILARELFARAWPKKI